MKKCKFVFAILSAVVVVYSSRYTYKHTFSKEKWLESDERVYMVDDMMRKHELLGMTKGEVISLLGSETEGAYFKESDNFVYWLGMERGLISIDSEWLVIVFENGVVSDRYITRD